MCLETSSFLLTLVTSASENVPLLKLKLYRILFTMLLTVINLVTETQCAPLVSYVVNTSSTRINTVVNVSCSGTTLSLVSVCDELGRWHPEIPICDS